MKMIALFMLYKRGNVTSRNQQQPTSSGASFISSFHKMNFLKNAVHDLLLDDGLVVLSRSCGYREVDVLSSLNSSSSLDLSNTMR